MLVHARANANLPFTIAPENTRGGNGLSLNSRFSIRKLVFKRNDPLRDERKSRKRNKRTVFPLALLQITVNVIRKGKQVRKYIPSHEGRCFPVFCCEAAMCVMFLPALVSISRMPLMVTDFAPLCQSRLYQILAILMKSYDYGRRSVVSILALIVPLDMTNFIRNLLSETLFWTRRERSNAHLQHCREQRR